MRTGGREGEIKEKDALKVLGKHGLRSGFEVDG